MAILDLKSFCTAFFCFAFCTASISAHDENPAWTTPGRLTLSFAPDGTDIGGYSNSLFSSFDGVVTKSQIRSLIIKAFQDWAVLSSINVGIVDDDATVPFGFGGTTQTNGLVGDIRIGAVPMAGDVFAFAIEHDNFLSGGWAGTMLFNSKAEFVDADQFYAVALHEAGHILGLEHSDDINSVMHPTALNTEFSSEDIEEIRSLYGSRNLDQFDMGGSSNNTIHSATEIEESGSIRGVVPAIAFGDISDPNDVDYFVLEPRDDYHGSKTTFRLINLGISAIDLMMTLTDEDGNPLGSPHVVIGDGGQGDDIRIVVNPLNEDIDYFVRIERAPSSGSTVGSYALVTTFEGPNLLDESTLDQIEPIIRRFFNFEDQEEIQELFCREGDNDCPIIDTGIEDDHGPKFPMNDTFATATVLQPLLEFPEQDRFRELASLSTDLTDVDFYRLRAPDCSSLFVEVTALEYGGPICDVALFDLNQNKIAGEVLVNGNGELLVQYENLVPDSDYFVKVVADDPVVFATGNYQLDLTFCRPNISVNELASGVISGKSPLSIHSLYVARSQLFHWSLWAGRKFSLPGHLEDATIWMSVIDEDGQVVHRVATRPNEKRSSRSVVLRPGSYSVRVNLTLPAKRSARFFIPIAYRIEGEGLGDPTGPEVIDGSDDPFAPCDKVSDDFCYPNGQMSPDEFIFVDDDGFVPDNLPPDPPWNDPNLWYWQTNWLG